MVHSGVDDRLLPAALAEIEAHVGAAGWDRPPVLFALVRSSRFAADDPQTAARLGIDRQDPDALTPVEQDALPEGPLDEALAGIEWPDSVDGCAVVQEIVILPPGAEEQAGDDPARAAAHPERRAARLVVGALRDGATAALLRLRAGAGSADELLTGPDLAPNLAAALRATLE